jgi:hypothetical protein
MGREAPSHDSQAFRNAVGRKNSMAFFLASVRPERIQLKEGYRNINSFKGERVYGTGQNIIRRS